MTYREQRQARAERLRGWAVKREAVASATLESHHKRYTGDHAFNFQPGHIPERARVIKQGERAFESLDKARSMASRADEIDRQAEHAIYSDDPDCEERLKERLIELEAKREKIKSENADYRKEHAAELKGLSVYQKEQLLPHPGYELTNLSGNIARNRKRLEQARRA